MKKSTIILLFLFCLLMSGCGKDSSKEQIITTYDYSTDEESEYASDDEAINEFVNNLSDYLLDGNGESFKIPEEAEKYKRVILYQGDKQKPGEQQKTDENKMMDIELYKYNEDFYCKAVLSFSDTNYEIKLSPELKQEILNLWEK